MKRLLLGCFFMIPFQLFAYVDNDEHFDHHKHQHGDREFGFSPGTVFLLNEQEVKLGIHSHLLWRIKSIDFLSIGLGVESVFDEHSHISTGFVTKVDIWKGFSALTSPGILFIKEANGWENYLSAHFELLYEFEIQRFHVGPALDFSVSRFDNHVMLGIHLGYSF